VLDLGITATGDIVDTGDAIGTTTGAITVADGAVAAGMIEVKVSAADFVAAKRERLTVMVGSTERVECMAEVASTVEVEESAAVAEAASTVAVAFTEVGTVKLS
jgi:hypothetical protein